MMHEDRLYNQFKAQLENYAPEVPAAVYSGMRRKLWWSQFLKFNASSLNVWYVGTALMVGAGLWLGTGNAATTAQIAKQHVSEITFQPIAETPSTCGSQTASVGDCALTCTKKKSCSTQPTIIGWSPNASYSEPVDQAPGLIASSEDQDPNVTNVGNNLEADPMPEALEVVNPHPKDPKPVKEKRRKYGVARY